MALLSIDYGEKKTGLAYSCQEIIAHPLKTVATEKLISFIQLLCKTHTIDKIVLGMPKGRLERKVYVFGESLKKILGKEIVYYDEYLSSKKAAYKLIDANISKKKRRKKEHEASAAVILQSYIDENKES